MDLLAPLIIVGAILAAVVVGFGVRLIVLLSREGSREVTTDPRPQRTAATDLALGFACFVYIVMMLMFFSSGSADPSHDPNTRGIVAALGELCEVVGVLAALLLWVLLAIVLFAGGIKGAMMNVAAGLLLLSGLAAIFAGHLYALYAGWSIVVPALLPPLIALYATWMRRPALHAALPAKIVNPAAWGAILILTIAPLPLSATDAAISASREAFAVEQRRAAMSGFDQKLALERARDVVKFQALTADSPLDDFLHDLFFSDRDVDWPPDVAAEVAQHFDQTLVKARQAKTRQTDAVTLLKEGGQLGGLKDLWQLDIEATPTVCKAYGDALNTAALIDLWETREAIKTQLPNMKWLLGEHCDLRDALAAVEAEFREACKPGRCPANSEAERTRMLEFTAAVAALRQPH
jgi:hypothetical protein